MTVAECIAHNRELFFNEYYVSPRRYKLYVVGRDPKARMIKVGGIGAMGVGQLWFTEVSLANEHGLRLPGFKDAPDMLYPGTSNNVDENMEREFQILKERREYVVSRN